MNQIYVRKIISDRHVFAGRKWWYEFGKELDSFETEAVTKYIAKRQEAYAAVAKQWDDTLNTEWTCRIFFAARMILAASVMLSSLRYAKQKNLLVCCPYLQYYSLLYSLKSLVLLNPSQKWKGGELIAHQTHTATINIACDELSCLDPQWTREVKGTPSVKSRILELKAFREIISYRAPSSGGSLAEHDVDVLPWCKTAVETAQMSSEILESSLAKHVSPEYKPELVDEDLEPIYLTSIGDTSFHDDEDYYRIRYLLRKHPFPTNILFMMSEGHVEDFFGSWCDPDGREDVFDPDTNWQILFNVP